MILGGDFSKWNGLGNWQIAKERGIRFAFIRAGSINGVTGACYRDDLLEEHIDGAESVGIPYGLYFYMRPRFDGFIQGDFFLKILEQYVPKLPAVIDVEEAGLGFVQAANNIEEMIATLKVYDERNIIYTRQSFYDANIAPSNVIGKCDLWAARWSSGLTSPWSDGRCKFRDWSDWRFWQFSADGNAQARYYGFPGYPAGDNDLDLNYFNGDEIAWAAYLENVQIEGGRMVFITTPTWLNVRSGPSTGYTDMGDLKGGLSFPLLEIQYANGYTWARIGNNAWIATGAGMAEIR